ncbi:hypothetical protein N7495_003702 [Penicillium taxi]|uniref:uncharacterized protein n=1 Tax=Penicillium taxi TaxID=168475 RepID=UPI00254582A0|nr:uncharacterized protein N7495_003702 [Penicillium taxi]KAJ5898958.1 hypothetical protein N7495_003702 [Penicillium taxi]
MPADYHSTARALALSTSPDASPRSPDSEEQLPWSRAGGRDSSSRWANNQAATYRDRLIKWGKETYDSLNAKWNGMTIWQKVAFIAAALIAAALGISFLLLSGWILRVLPKVAERWEKSPLVAFILWTCVFFVSFPPLVGWSTMGTSAGFIFGIWKGWLLYASATILGSTVSFYVSRTLLSKLVNALMKRDKRFAALALTLKYDGLKLLCMIRLCPLPYSICNGAVSTFPTVKPLMYGLATAIVSPKLLTHVFIGSRLRILAETGDQMSTGAKAVNIISIIASGVIGVGTGYYIYQRTLARANELEAIEREDNENADHSAHQPRDGLSEDDATNDAFDIARDEEELLGFSTLDDDNVDLDLDDESDNEPGRWKSSRTSYHDQFTDNDSDDLESTNDVDETYGLHRHIQRK